MEAAGVKQKPLSKKMGRTDNYINLVLNGQRLPNYCEFLAIVEAFDGDPAALTAEVVRRSLKARKPASMVSKPKPRQRSKRTARAW